MKYMGDQKNDLHRKSQTIKASPPTKAKAALEKKLKAKNP